MTDATKLGCLCGHGERCKRCSPYATNEPGECWREDCTELRAMLARVEALPAKWRQKAHSFLGAWTQSDDPELQCADELEAALKDP